MENKLTAVEWLKNNLIINGSGATTTFPELFTQAKAMEKDQILKAFEINYDYPNGIAASERYYKRTYGTPVDKE